MGPALMNSIFVTHVTTDEMVIILKSLKNGAPGPEESNAMLLKMV